MFDTRGLAVLLEHGGFDRSRVEIENVTLPLGIAGIVAIAGKTPRLFPHGPTGSPTRNRRSCQPSVSLPLP